MSRWVRWFLVSVVLVMLTACGGNPVSPDDNGTTDTPVVNDDNGTKEPTISTKKTVSGSSYKGIIKNAVVEIYDFSNNTKGKLLSSGKVNDSVFALSDVSATSKILVEIKKDANNTATYEDEDSGSVILFNDLVLKSIIANPDETKEYVVTPLTTLAAQLVIDGIIDNFDNAQKQIAKLFGLSFDKLDSLKPNIRGFGSSSKNSKENEYALSILSLIAYQNEINSATEKHFSFEEIISLILKDLSDGVFDGKENNSSLTIKDVNATLTIGDLPKRIASAGSRSLSRKNPMLLEKMKGYFLRAITASRAIEPPTVEIESSTHIRLNEKSFFSADGSVSPFGYPLTYAWTIQSSPKDANVSFSDSSSVHTFLTVDTEGNYTVSLDVSDGQNSVTKEINITADLDGDGLFSYEDMDIDGDGILNTDDKFANDPSEFLDSDNDGVGNFAQADEDNDGVADDSDDYPFDDSKGTVQKSVSIG